MTGWIFGAAIFPLLSLFAEIVYEKHYLTPEGIDYFQNQWLPLAHAIIAKQKGFVSIAHEQDSVDCMNIILKFKDEETFDAWVAYPSHDDLVNALDVYRSRSYWEAVRTQDEQIDPSTLEWMVLKPKLKINSPHKGTSAIESIAQRGLNISERIFGAFLEAHKLSSPGKPLLKRTIDDLRVDTRVFRQYVGDPANVSFVDQTVPARDGFPLSIRIYNDSLPAGTPVLIFYPGCAFVFDLSEVNRVICSRIAQQAGIKVILVQFRLAPENPMPISLYDGYDAAVYITTHSDDFGIDPCRIFLGGWCSGAHCAAAVSSLARQSNQLSIYHQILLSGNYDLTESTHNFDDYEKEDKILNRAFTAHIARQYYGIGPNDYQNPLLSPYHETNFAGLPPTTILVGEYDALRNDSEGYFRKLKDHGISIEKVVLPGQTHNTIAMRKVLSDGPDPAQVIAEIVKAKLIHESR